METHVVRRFAGLVAAVASGLLVADLFLGWQRASVEIAGVVQTEASSMGWGGWGSFVGLFALLIFIVALRDLGGNETTAHHLATVGILPFGLLASTLLAVFTGDASVNVADTVSVEVDTTLWPAWVGLLLAVVASIAAFVPVALELGRPAPRGLPGPV
jgi:hypothetical protein